MVEIFEVASPENKCFYCETGQVLHTINELKVGLAFCKINNNREIFDKHVHSNKNDFSNWIRDVFGYTDLASKIYNIQDPEEMLKVLNNYEQQYNLNLLSNQKDENNKGNKGNNQGNNKESIKKDDSKTTKLSSNVQNEAFFESQSKSEPKTNPNLTSNESLKEEIEQRYERADKEFDRVKKIKQRSIYDKANYAESVEVLKTKYDELQSIISDMRKEGKDVSIPSMLLRNLQPKITYFQVSQNHNDYERVTKGFDEIQEELQEANKPKKKSLREEILEKAKLLEKVVVAKKEER